MTRKVGQDMVVKKRMPENRLIDRYIVRDGEMHSVPVSNTSLQEKKPVSTSHDSRKKPQQIIRDYTEREYVSPKKNTSHRDDSLNDRPITQKIHAGVLWWFVAVAAIVLVGIGMSALSRTQVAVQLREVEYPVSKEIIAYLEPSENDLGFKFAQAIDRQTVSIPPESVTGTDTSGTKASGTIRIFSQGKSQNLPVGTKVMSTNKTVFVTEKSVVVPAGTSATPGSIDVDIVAVVPGEAGNVGRDDFTSGTNLIGRSITEIAGGSTIGKPVINEAAAENAKTTLQTMMSTTHPVSFLANQIPVTYRIPESLVRVSEPVYTVIATDHGVVMTAERTITGYMIARDDLDTFLLNTSIPETEQSFMTVFQSNTVTMQLAPSYTGTHQEKQIPIILSGSFTARAKLDNETIKPLIARKKKTDAINTVREIPGVETVSIRIWPPWIFRVTDQARRILVSIDYKKV